MRRLMLAVVVVVATLALAGCSSGSALTGKTWQWTTMATTAPTTALAVPDTEQTNYTIEFKSDGTFSSKADCNQVGGRYTATASNGLTINPGPSTLVACPEGSMGSVFIGALSSSANYAIANGTLTITTMEASTLTFK
jgi:heat shock protein HslJ